VKFAVKLKLGSAIAATLFSGAVVFAQQGPDPGPFSSDLISWSFMQEPQQPEPKPAEQRPTPDPNPETRSPENPTPAQPGSASQQTQTENQAPTAQTFIGTISKDADNFVLRVSQGTSYKLDNQQQVQQFEGQRVRVTGTLDRSTNLIHVDQIEPIS
jgi:Protein of unknown function (DUF5818)